MGIDPVTHKPKITAIGCSDGNSTKDVATLNHMAQLEAKARLVREAKLLAASSNPPLQFHQPARQNLTTNKAAIVPRVGRTQCLDMLKVGQGKVSNMFSAVTSAINDVNLIEGLKLPTSTLSFLENTIPITLTVGFSENQFVSDSHMCGGMDFKDVGVWLGEDRSAKVNGRASGAMESIKVEVMTQR
ncbi:transcription factor MYB106-like [Carica papaya]|uniref:transcription factor MYB106-like n=1 Tax=Carica papaya TaxID=3649 RepID=UPI000B8C792F|nr:transcription factor MYB106-like [Carica papaya]